MIYIFGIHNGLLSFRRYIELNKENLAGVRTYPNISTIRCGDVISRSQNIFFDGAYIFTDISYLSGQQIEKLSYLTKELQSGLKRTKILNNPLIYKSRYELLRYLYEEGVNNHNVFRLTEHRVPDQWPVFVRHELGHWHSPLLRDEAELRTYIENMENRGIWRGDKIIVEFNDYRSKDGLYRSYGAFRIGSRIVLEGAYTSPNWYMRDFEDMPGMLTDTKLIAEELECVRSNRHAKEVLKVFERVGIEYGRMDFALVEGRLQVWEINSAPVLPQVSQFSADRPLRHPKLKLFSERLCEAFAELDQYG